MQGKRNEWHGHSKTIAHICGCSTTAVSKILNGRSAEVTSNQELIKNVKRVASELLLRDANILLDRVQEKRKIAADLAD